MSSISVISEMMPSVKRNPAARSLSSPGVLIVIATGRVMRSPRSSAVSLISRGSSTDSVSSKLVALAPVIFFVVTFDIADGGSINCMF